MGPSAVLSLPIVLAQFYSLYLLSGRSAFSCTASTPTWWLSCSPHEPITSSAHHSIWLSISLYLWAILRSSDPSKSYVPALDFITYTSGTSTSAKSCTSLSLPLYVWLSSLWSCYPPLPWSVVLAQTSWFICWDKLYCVFAHTMAYHYDSHTPISTQSCPDV